MSNVTVNISFQNGLLDEIDAEAKKESRSRSELIREAARVYVRRQRRWDSLFALGDSIAKRQRLAQNDVNTAIKSVRRRDQASE